jgi:hypothetical protein
MLALFDEGDARCLLSSVRLILEYLVMLSFYVGVRDQLTVTEKKQC